MKRLERLIAMALLLTARRRMRAAELSAHFGISDRTVYRDMRALQQAGFAVEGNAGDGYRVPQDAFLRPLSLTEPEAEALAMAAQLLGLGADERLRERLGSATAKLESVLDPAARRRVRQHRAEVFLSGFERKKAGPLGVILDALREHEVLRIVYHAVGTENRSERDIEPLGLVLLEEAWLLVAWCRKRQDARAFRVDRIQRVTAIGATFAPRQGMSFAEVLERERANRNRRTGS